MDNNLLSSFQSLIMDLDESAYLGEIVATIADSVDQDLELEEDEERVKFLKLGLEKLTEATDDLRTFDEETAWEDWEELLDEIFEADHAGMATMLEEIGLLLANKEWRKKLVEGNPSGSELDRANESLVAAAGYLSMLRDTSDDV